MHDSVWWLIGIVGVGTLLLRSSFFLLFRDEKLSPSRFRPLRFVPAAVLSALVLPALIAPGLPLEGPALLGNPRLFAGLLAGIVAFRTRNMLWTLATGMGSLWILQSLGYGS